MTRRETLRLYALAMSSGVLLGGLADPYLPIAGLAAAYIVGDLIWTGVRRLVPPSREERP